MRYHNTASNIVLKYAILAECHALYQTETARAKVFSEQDLGKIVDEEAQKFAAGTTIEIRPKDKKARSALVDYHGQERTINGRTVRFVNQY